MKQMVQNITLTIPFGMPIPQMHKKCSDFMINNKKVVFEIIFIEKVEWTQEKKPAIKLNCNIVFCVNEKEYDYHTKFHDKPKLKLLKGKQEQQPQ